MCFVIFVVFVMCDSQVVLADSAILDGLRDRRCVFVPFVSFGFFVL